jgi:hypothetical protein
MFGVLQKTSVLPLTERSTSRKNPPASESKRSPCPVRAEATLSIGLKNKLKKALDSADD